MSHFFLIMCGVISAAITYGACSRTQWIIRCILSLTIGLLTSILLLFLAPSSSPHTNLNSVIVGISGDFPPFTFVQEGEIVGFDKDLIEEIGRRLTKKIVFKNMPFSTLLPSLQLGTLHVVASGVTPTTERAQRVLFTQPYIENNPLVIVSLSSAPAENIKDIVNKEVIVNEGYTADSYISNLTGERPTVRRLKSPAEAFLALKSGRSFAFVTAHNTVKPFFDHYGTDQFHVAVIPNTEESASLAIAPQYPKLLEEIESALETMKKDNTLQNLKNKWGL